MPVPSVFWSCSSSSARFSASPSGMDDVQFKVGAVEAGVDDLGIGHAQLGEDVLDDVGRGRGRQGHDGRPAQVVDGLAQGQIVGAKVVAPLADAVSLVDDEQLDFPALRAVAELWDRRGARAWCRRMEAGPRRCPSRRRVARGG